jgi:hypothetical protein
VDDRHLEEFRDPARLDLPPYGAGDFLGVAGAHREEVAHSHCGEVFAHRGRELIREEGDHLVVDAEQTLLHRNRDARDGDAFRERVHHVRPIGAIGRPPAFADHVAAARQHEAVQL